MRTSHLTAAPCASPWEGRLHDGTEQRSGTSPTEAGLAPRRGTLGRNPGSAGAGAANTFMAVPVSHREKLSIVGRSPAGMDTGERTQNEECVEVVIEEPSIVGKSR